MLLGTHILKIVQQFVPQLATWNLCLYVGTDSVPPILDYVDVSRQSEREKSEV